MKAVEERLTITFPKLADKTLWYPWGDVLTEPGLFLVFGHEQVSSLEQVQEETITPMWSQQEI